MSTMFTIYRDAPGVLRWRLQDEHGVVAESARAYGTREACERAIEAVRAAAPHAGVDVDVPRARPVEDLQRGR